MTDKQLLENVNAIITELCKAAAHAVVDVGRLNDTAIEVEKRLRDIRKQEAK